MSSNKIYEKRLEYIRLYKQYIHEFWVQMANPSIYFNKELLTEACESEIINAYGHFLRIIKSNISVKPETANKLSAMRKELTKYNDFYFIHYPIRGDWDLYKNYLMYKFITKLRYHSIRIQYNAYTQEEFMKAVSSLCYVAYKIAFIDQSFEIWVENKKKKLLSEVRHNEENSGDTE